MALLLAETLSAERESRASPWISDTASLTVGPKGLGAPVNLAIDQGFNPYFEIGSLSPSSISPSVVGSMSSSVLCRLSTGGVSFPSLPSSLRPLSPEDMSTRHGVGLFLMSQ